MQAHIRGRQRSSSSQLTDRLLQRPRSDEEMETQLVWQAIPPTTHLEVTVGVARMSKEHEWGPTLVSFLQHEWDPTTVNFVLLHPASHVGFPSM